MLYKENEIYRYMGEDYRIIGIDLYKNNLFLINMNKNCTWSKVIKAEVFEKALDNKEVTEVKDRNFMYINIHDLNEKSIEKMEFFYEIICFLLKNSPNYEIFYSKERDSIINKAIEKYEVSYSTIKRIFSTYFKNGKVKTSLVPKLYKCGGKGKERTILIKKSEVIIDGEIKRLFKVGINKYYNKSNKITKKMCYELIIRDYLKLSPYKKIPTLNQFYYWFDRLTENNKKTEISLRYGSRIYQQNSRPIIGNSISDTLAPADLYQVDSTILDIYIVSKLNRNLIVGRPVLYFIVDTYSRMIVGMNVTVEPFNSYIGVQGALINTMSDKVKYCKNFGIDINKEEWDVNYIPNRILADRGELLSENILNAIENLGIQIQNTPPYRGDLKGIVEKAFERIHSYIKPFCDGVVENKFNKVERGDEDYRLKANLTLEEITKIIIKYVLFYNNHHVLENYESDGLDIKSDVAKIPKNIWNYGVKIKKGLLRELDEEFVKVNLMNNKEATVTEKGVKINKLLYVSKWTLKEGWYERARINGSYKVRVSYNPNNISSIYYIKSDGISIDELTLVKYKQQYKSLSEEEYKKVLEHEKKLNDKAKTEELERKLKLYDDIEEITKKAKDESKGCRNKEESKSNRLKNMRNNLERERNLNRGNQEYREDKENYQNELDIFEEELGEWGDYYE